MCVLDCSYIYIYIYFMSFWKTFDSLSPKPNLRSVTGCRTENVSRDTHQTKSSNGPFSFPRSRCTRRAGPCWVATIVRRALTQTLSFGRRSTTASRFEARECCRTPPTRPSMSLLGSAVPWALMKRTFVRSYPYSGMVLHEVAGLSDKNDRFYSIWFFFLNFPPFQNCTQLYYGFVKK